MWHSGHFAKFQRKFYFMFYSIIARLTSNEKNFQNYETQRLSSNLLWGPLEFIMGNISKLSRIIKQSPPTQTMSHTLFARPIRSEPKKSISLSLFGKFWHVFLGVRSHPLCSWILWKFSIRGKSGTELYVLYQCEKIALALLNLVTKCFLCYKLAMHKHTRGFNLRAGTVDWTGLGHFSGFSSKPLWHPELIVDSRSELQKSKAFV